MKQLLQPSGVLVETDEAWNAVSSPVRMEMVQLFESEGPVTVAELAEAMGRPADGLYHHIHILEGAGLIEQTGVRATAGGRRTEALYGLRFDNLMFATGPEHHDKRAKALRVMLNQAMRNVDRAVRSGIARLRGAEQNLVFRSEFGVLTQDEIGLVRSKMAEIESVFHGARGRKGPGRRTNVMLIMTPIAPHGRIGRENENPARADATGANGEGDG